MSASAEPRNTANPEPAVGYIHTANFPDLLRSLKISLAVTTYQANRILFFSPSSPTKLFMLMRIFERPTGLAIAGGRLALCCESMVWQFQAPARVQDKDGKDQPFDIFFVPRHSWVTGDIAGHETAFIQNEIHVVNTRFSCICKLSDQYSFKPLWKPPFVTEIAPEDRCHLNGFALDGETIRYVSALGETNTAQGWRPRKADGGILMEYPSGKIISRGLSMPHSPRLYGGALWILNSGIGEVQLVDRGSGNRRTVVRLPGFLRGLAMSGSYLFVGLSRIREKKEFGNLPIENLFPELECAIYAIEIQTAKIVGFIKFTKGIEELFDVQILPGVQNPHILGFEEDTVKGTFILE